MFKWLNWAIRTAATAVLLSFLCIWTTGYIVNSYMETLLKQLDLPLATQPFALSGIWGTMWGAEPTAKTQASAAPSASASASPSIAPAVNTDSVSKPTESADVGAGTSKPEESVDEQAGSPSPTASEDADAEPVFGGQSGDSSMSEEQRLSLQTVMSKLNAEQLNKLSASLEGGLTEEEWTQLGEMIKPNLSENEYKQMMEILKTHKTAEPAPAPSPQR